MPQHSQQQHMLQQQPHLQSQLSSQGVNPDHQGHSVNRTPFGVMESPSASVGPEYGPSSRTGGAPTAKEMEDAIKGMLFKKEQEVPRPGPENFSIAGEDFTGLPSTINKLNIPAGECERHTLIAWRRALMPEIFRLRL